MNRFLLILAASLAVAHAQSEVAASSAFAGGEGVNGEVNAMAVQTDGKIVIGGKFTAVNGVPRNNIARLNADGSLDRTFSEEQANGVNGQINALAIQPDGGIVVGGLFTQAGQVETMNLARYKADGSVDKTFGGAGNAAPGTNGVVLALAVQADGKIVVGGNFNSAFGQPCRSIARLKADGTLDGPVPAQSALLNGPVKALAANPNGTVVAGGLFTVENQNARSLFQTK
jgi:uncharacterized delta-60 repeat protein